MKPHLVFSLSWLALWLASSCQAQPVSGDRQTVPSWASGAIFYQIFPERFRNGDPNNDPTYQSLEYRSSVSDTWQVSPWTSDWYQRQPWEKASGDNFYHHGVFHRRYGGDLQGVIDKLDYLQRLGVNTLYFNPLFYARSLHKYDGNTFHHIDPYFGPTPQQDLEQIAAETSDPSSWRWTSADKLFLSLIDQAHRRGLRIIIDGVFNHTGRDFFAFADLRRRQSQSRYKDWYIVEQFDDPETASNEFKYEGWWGVESLPVFADTPDGTDLHPGPKQYIFDATRRWMDPDGDGDPGDGVDGWRLDVAGEVPIQFWTDWNTYVRKLNPEAYTVAELWGSAADTLVQGRFSATMNYQGFAFPCKGFFVDGKVSARQFADELQRQRAEFPIWMQPALQNLLDSHDTERIASMIVNAGRPGYQHPEKNDYDVGELASPRYFTAYDISKPNADQRRIQRLVGLFQFTYVGAPMIYYGTEAGMWGADDPDDRKPMVWEDLQHAAEITHPSGAARRADQVRFDPILFRYYQSLAHLRRDHPSLQNDSFHVIHAADAASTLAFVRRGRQDSTLCVFNRSRQTQTITLHGDSLGFPRADQAKLRVQLISSGSEDDLRIQSTPAAIQLTIAGLTGAVLDLAAKR